MSKLTPEVFFDLLFYASSLSQNSSLEYLTSYLDAKYGIDIRKQSLDERFTEKTVDFVKSVLKRLISEQFSDSLYCKEFLSCFNHVRIKDSTKFIVPNNLSAHYKGNGGNGDISNAGITIQYEFDLKTGKFLDLNVTEAIRNDQQDAKETAENVCKNDLIIRDLGYFSTTVLQKIDKDEAFYLSRFKSDVSVYDDNGQEVDFEKIYKQMSDKRINYCEKQVFISKDKVPVRLYIGLVPPEVYQARMRRKQQEEKSKGRQMKKRTKFLLQFNLFVTNLDDKKLPAEKIMPLYRFRWQVELQFLNWKSVFCIHKLQKMKENRYITMLYIRMILIIVNLQIINRVQSLMPKNIEEDGILSNWKTCQTMKNSFSEILYVLRSNTENAIEQLGEIYRILSKNHQREKRKKRENFVENIYLFI
jgi:Transposase DDE domain.